MAQGYVVSEFVENLRNHHGFVWGDATLEDMRRYTRKIEATHERISKHNDELGERVKELEAEKAALEEEAEKREP